MRTLLIALGLIVAISTIAVASNTFGYDFQYRTSGADLASSLDAMAAVWLVFLGGFGVVGFNLKRRRADTMALLATRMPEIQKLP